MTFNRLIRRLTPVVQALLAMATASQAFAATRVFTGGPSGTGSDWSLSANWRDGLMPRADDSAELGSHDVFIGGAASVVAFSGTGKLSVLGRLSFSALSSVASLTISDWGLLDGHGTVNGTFR